MLNNDVPLETVYKWLLRDYKKEVEENKKLKHLLNGEATRKYKEKIKAQKQLIDELMILDDESLFEKFIKSNELKKYENKINQKDRQILKLKEIINNQKITIEKLILNNEK